MTTHVEKCLGKPAKVYIWPMTLMTLIVVSVSFQYNIEAKEINLVRINGRNVCESDQACQKSAGSWFQDAGGSWFQDAAGSWFQDAAGSWFQDAECVDVCFCSMGPVSFPDRGQGMFQLC
jgi:hypothetical protein